MTGANSLTINQVFTWNGGTISGGGSVNIASGGVLNIFGNDTASLNATTLNNAGTVNLTSDSNQFELDNGAVIQNNSGALFDLQSDGTVFGNGGGASSTIRRHLAQIEHRNLRFHSSLYQRRRRERADWDPGFYRGGK